MIHVRLLLLLAASMVLSLATAAHAARPNLVFVIADDLTFRDLGCYGGQAHTPNIDRLATQGMKFERCFQAAPMCSPTRHNIYTGLYPVKSGAYPNHTRTYPHVKSIVQYLKPLGYRVALSGKTHIGPRSVFSFEYSGKKNPDMKAIDTLMAESKAAATPFCLFACSNEPHSPWNKGDASRYPPSKVQLPPYLSDTPVMREYFSRYLAEITYYDGQVGEILRLLDKHQLSDNTLVVVVSEQGNSFPFAKWTCYDNGLQSGMIVRWPGRVKASVSTRAMVEYVDITPTFLAAAGAKPVAGLDGKSFLPVLEGMTQHHKDHVFGIMTTRGIINGSEAYAIRSIRSEKFKLIWNLNHQSKFTNAATKHATFESMRMAAQAGDKTAAELVRRYHHRPEFELYDVMADPLEMVNVAGDSRHARTMGELKERLHNWMKEQGDEGVATELKAGERQGRQRKRAQK